MTARLFAITNQKGGVGKTTTAINLAASFSQMKRRVLLVDLDPQGNATTGSGASLDSERKNVGDLLLGNATAKECLLHCESGGYDLLPSGGELVVVEMELLAASDRQYRLREGLRPVQEEYDFILIDCPPGLNVLTLNAMLCSHGLIVPVQCEYFSLEGLTILMRTIEHLRKTHPQITIAGLVRTQYDGRNRLSREVSEQLKQHFSEKVYHTIIPRNVRIAEAPSHGLPVAVYDRACRGAEAYIELAGEILRLEETAAENHGR